MWEINKEMYAGVDFHGRGWEGIKGVRRDLHREKVEFPLTH